MKECSFLEVNGYCTFWTPLVGYLIECKFPKKEYFCNYNKDYDNETSKKTKEEDF